MELARVLTELSNAHSSEPEATFSDAMATPLSFLQPRAAAHTSSSHPRVQTNAASNDTFDGSDDEASERRPKIIERRRQRKRMKQQRSSNTSAAAMSDDDAPRRSDAKLERTRQLQNLRQQRYRARKKCSLSALQQRSQQLAVDNARLECAIRARLALP